LCTKNIFFFKEKTGPQIFTIKINQDFYFKEINGNKLQKISHYGSIITRMFAEVFSATLFTI